MSPQAAASALLVAAHGKGDTDSPVTGTLADALKPRGLTMAKQLTEGLVFVLAARKT